MEIGELDRKQSLTLLAAALLLFGLLVLPLLVQEFYGVNAVKTAFVVIVIYALVNWWMKNQN